MNNEKLIFVIILISMSFCAKAQIKIRESGNVGIGYNAPADKLWVEGTARISAWTDILY